MARDPILDVKWLKVGEVADIMRVAKMTIYRMVRDGELPASRFGKSLRIAEQDLAAYLREGMPAHDS